MFKKWNFWVSAVLASMALGLWFCQSAQASGSDELIFSENFENSEDKLNWSGWSVDQNVSIETVSPGYESSKALLFSVPKESWNTPIINFKPPLPVTENTVVRFKIKLDREGRYGMNIQNATEGAEYYLSFTAEKDKWFTVQKYLKNASYKRFGKPDVPKDGMLGDALSGIQIACLGQALYLDDFEILNVSSPVRELPEEEKLIEGKYELKDYNALKRGGVFPFGVISTVEAGDAVNGGFFNQTKQERFADDMVDLKQHYMNTMANFCDDVNIPYRISLMKKYNMYLVETCFSNSDFRNYPPEQENVLLMKQFINEERLLGWYGEDEPKDYKQYLENKLTINKIDSNHPLASAFNEMSAVKTLGPYLELAMIDLYSIPPGPKSINGVLSHADSIRTAKEYCAGKKVWLITQAFSLRQGKTVIFRYPYPEEVRFDVFNAISAGVNGILFFIYNDTVPYLDGKFRGEEFDYTLVDGWGNDNPTYEELARIGKIILPVMPSLLDAAEIKADRYEVNYPKEKLVCGKLTNKYGTYLIFVNKNLEESFQGSIDITLPENEKIYDLINLKQVRLRPETKFELNLLPGDGSIFMVGVTENYSKVEEEIRARKIQMEYERLKMEVELLKTAKITVDNVENALKQLEGSIRGKDYQVAFEELNAIRVELEKVQNGNTEYGQFKLGLESAKKVFGAINAMILKDILAVEETQNKEWLERFDKLKTLSSKYFKLRREWKTGDFSNKAETSKLISDITAVQLSIEFGRSSH